MKEALFPENNSQTKQQYLQVTEGLNKTEKNEVQRFNKNNNKILKGNGTGSTHCLPWHFSVRRYSWGDSCQEEKTHTGQETGPENQ